MTSRANFNTTSKTNEQEAMVKDALKEHKEEELPENRVNIDDINIITNINTSQMKIQQHSAIHQDNNTTINQLPSHNYNLRKRPKNRKRNSLEKLTKLQDWGMKGNTQQSTQRCTPM